MVPINPAEIEKQDGSESKIRFRWTYIVLPVTLFLLSLILAACFFPFLADEIAYHFQNDIPDRWLSRGALIGWMIIPQVFFTILSIVVVRIIMLTSRYLPQRNSPLPSLLPMMGNMIALPQIVLIFAMLDFFLYNTQQIKLIPLWIFTLIVLAGGIFVLGVFFIQAIRRSRRLKAKISQE
ncbi:MAG: hypothetical protein A2Y89_00250 [Chloroflexi bacterium RBG_13_51_18]|nr:MAG: hypothetical protein A2Y89_00250 [Chloroflexi bacterium RBG_13_51_18]